MFPIIILAGGTGSRMGDTGKIIPKFLLPINGDIPLIRTIKLAIGAGHSQITICAGQEHSDQIRTLINLFFNNGKIINIKYANKSLLQSLKNLKKSAKPTGEHILVLGDIYYLDNPFLNLYSDYPQGDILIGKKTTNPLELKSGGIIEINKSNRVQKIIKQPTKNISLGVRWSGMAFCGKHFFDDLVEIERVIRPNNFSLEDIFEYRNKKYKNSRVIDNINFVNINSLLHYTYANILSAEKNQKNKGVKDVISQYSDKIRELILKNGHQL